VGIDPFFVVQRPSPKGGGFLFVGIRKMNGMGQVEFCLEKGCMTLIMVRGIPDKINSG
jgi:hypothetical protein